MMKGNTNDFILNRHHPPTIVPERDALAQGIT